MAFNNPYVAPSFGRLPTGSQFNRFAVAQQHQTTAELSGPTQDMHRGVTNALNTLRNQGNFGGRQAYDTLLAKTGSTNLDYNAVTRISEDQNLFNELRQGVQSFVTDRRGARTGALNELNRAEAARGEVLRIGGSLEHRFARSFGSGAHTVTDYRMELDNARAAVGSCWRGPINYPACSPWNCGPSHNHSPFYTQGYVSGRMVFGSTFPTYPVASNTGFIPGSRAQIGPEVGANGVVNGDVNVHKPLASHNTPNAQMALLAAGAAYKPELQRFLRKDILNNADGINGYVAELHSRYGVPAPAQGQVFNSQTLELARRDFNERGGASNPRAAAAFEANMAAVSNILREPPEQAYARAANERATGQAA